MLPASLEFIYERNSLFVEKQRKEVWPFLVPTLDFKNPTLHYLHIIAQTEEFAQMKKVLEETKDDVKTETKKWLKGMEQMV